jgi:hypothetical protein
MESQNGTLKTLLHIAILFAIYALVVIVLDIPSIYQNGDYALPDGVSYVQAAKDFYLHHKLNAIRPVGISILIGAPMLISTSFTHFAEWVWFMNAVFWLGALMIFNKILCKLTNNRWANFSTVVVALYFSLIIYSTQIISEIPFVFFILCTVYYAVRFMQSKNKINLLYICLFLLVCVFIRPGLLYLFYFVVMAILFYCLYNKYIPAIVTLAVCAITMHLYQVQMNKQFGKYTISFIGQNALLFYLDNRAKQLSNKTSFDQENIAILKSISDKSTAEIYDIANIDFKNQLRNNLPNLCSAFVWNLIENSNHGNPCLQVEQGISTKKWRSFICQLITFITLWQNVVLSIFTLIGCLIIRFYARPFLPKEIYYLLISLTGICVYLMCVSAISFYQHDRFHIVFAPIITIVISSLLYFKFSKNKQ